MVKASKNQSGMMHCVSHSLFSFAATIDSFALSVVVQVALIKPESFIS